MKDVRIGVIGSEFNRLIVDALVQGALETLKAQGIEDHQIEVAKVPGAFELPLAAKKMIQTLHLDAVICVGCVIRGETSHYDLVCNEAARGIQAVSLETGIPIGFGLVTADNLDQALDRAGGKVSNKGQEAAFAALHMLQLFRKWKTER
ncbi:MAG: 6,7-dimethyl-8-ribityllumazine synthase [Deltaproteobacteria bacterium RIFCSPHIGHO2_02_FULL_40_11]|nr:MAG: 6,7-dimethyl-8-ribityllumazine synthase [Deltaproteobacteria bacterium RIFCSPHIGHO2_02_FULL_40_11]